MAFEGDYAESTLTNPGTALTSFALLVDLAELPQDWWDAVTSSDGTKGRASKGDGSTEVACDWIDFDDSGESGWLRTMWSGSLAKSGIQNIRIYPPLTGNSIVAATAEFGQYNVYDANWIAYWPLTDVNDRTDSQFTLTEAGSVPTGGGTGKVGAATHYDGSDDRHTSSATPGQSEATYLAWVNMDDLDEARNIILVNVANAFWWWVGTDSSTNNVQSFYNGGYVESNTALTAGVWTHLAVRNNTTADETQFFINGVADGTPEYDLGATPTDIAVGGTADGSKLCDGLIDEVQIHNAIRETDWIAEEYAQSDDNSSFWGAWSWSGGAAAASIISGIVFYQRRMRV